MVDLSLAQALQHLPSQHWPAPLLMQVIHLIHVHGHRSACDQHVNVSVSVNVHVNVHVRIQWLLVLSSR